MRPVQTREKVHVPMTAAGGWVAMCLVLSCAPVPLVPPPPPPPARIAVQLTVPSDHDKDKHGAWHKRGYKRPVGVCDPCHGKDLRGTAEARSCFACHGNEWD